MIAGRHHIFGRSRTTLQRQVMISNHTGMRHLVKPVCPFSECRNFVIGIVWVLIIQGKHFISHIPEFRTIQELEPFGDCLNTERRVQSDLRLSFFTLFGRDQNNAVGGT